MATLAQVARRYPSFLVGTLEDSNPTVRVHYFDAMGARTSVDVQRTVMVSDIPQTGGRAYGASGGDNARGPLWPAMVEKAYALTAGEIPSYDAIAGKSSSEAIRWMTGLHTQTVKLRQHWGEEEATSTSIAHFRRIKSAWLDGELVLLHIGGHAFDLQDVSEDPDVLVVGSTAMIRPSRLLPFVGRSQKPLSLRIAADRMADLVGAYVVTLGAPAALCRGEHGGEMT